MPQYSANFFVLRTPLYHLGINDSSLTQIVGNGSFIEAIFLSSPNLFNEIEKYLNGSLDGKEKEKLELSLYRYYLRSCYRCTPFGMFAGISLGEIAEQTNIQLAPTLQYQKKTRLDTHFLASFAKQMLEDDAVRSMVKWQTNNTVYLVGNKVRYIEYKVNRGIRSHNLTNVDSSEYIQLILEKAKNGGTIAELAGVLVSDEIPIEDAVAFVNEMITSCLLISEFEPHVTGKEYHIQLLEKLKGIKSAECYLLRLQSTISVLKETDQNGLGTLTKYYDDIVLDIKNWQTDFDPGMLFQCDLLKPTLKCQINSNIIEELNKVISFLVKITPIPERPNLKKFKEEFMKRYESQEMSLLTVLDSDTGIGYPVNEQAYSDNTPLLSDLQLHRTVTSESQFYKSNKWSKFILQKYQRAIENNLTEIEITDNEINSHLKDDNQKSDSLPNAAYTICSLLSQSDKDADNGNFLIYHEVTAGPSGANLLSRFCFMDEELKNFTRELIQKEEQANTDCIYAEILHIPQSRLGNVSMRPLLREYEIPILTHAAVDEAHTIPLSDLMVSIKKDEIHLRSKKFNKKIIPRLTTAHNFSLNPVCHYHFLCDLQFQSIKGTLSWNWEILNEFTYLPRIRYGKTILSKARWRLSLKDLTVKKDISEKEFGELIRAYFAHNRIPNHVTISQGDNQLPIDIESSYCLKILIQDLKKFETLELQECLFNESNLLVKGPEGGYTNELIIPWTKQVAKNNATNFKFQTVNRIDVQRSFLPGDQWHYIKIYCGVKSADKILIEELRPLTEELLSEGKINKWFFIRYADPDHHIRVRLLGNDTFYADVTERLNKAFVPYLKSHLIWKVQTDTYERELERYGHENIENSESFFSVDSLATLKVLSLLDGDEGDELRWQFAIKGVNDLVDDFGYSLEEKEKVMIVLRDGFRKEFNAEDRQSQKQLSEHYRKYRKEIDLILSPELEDDHEYSEVWKIFKQRSFDWAITINEIKEYAVLNKSALSLDNLLGSYIHMFLNRFIRSKQRMHELVIYDFLCQYYRSRIAREKKLKETLTPVNV